MGKWRISQPVDLNAEAVAPHLKRLSTSDRELQTMQFLRTLLVSIFAVFVCANVCLSQDNDTSSKKQPAIVLKNATIHTLTGKAPFVGSVVIVDGKILAVDAKVKTPKNANVIDLDGCHLVPGLIESRSKLWLTNNSIRETSTKAELNVVDGIDPWTEDWRELASQGITSVFVQPSSSATLGGYGAVVRVGPHGSPDAIVMKKESAVQASVGLTGRSSKDRAAQAAALEKLLESAKKEWDKQKKEAEAQAKKDKAKKPAAKKTPETEDEKKGTDKKESGKAKTAEDEKEADEDKKADEKKPDSAELTTDTAKLALIRVLKKEIPLHVEVHHSDVLERILKTAKKYKIRIVLDGLSNVESCCEELVAAGFPAVIGPLYEIGTPPTYRKDAEFDWLGKDFSKAETSPLWSLSSFSNSARSGRLLRVQAALAVQLGVSPKEALEAISSNPARILGVSEHVGTIEKGKQADIAVFFGDPLDPSTPTRLVLSHGTITFDRDCTANPEFKTTDSANDLPSVLPEHFAIKTTRLLKNGKFTEGILVVKDGKVVSSGKNAKTDGIQVFDLNHAVITPGLVAASSTLGQSANIVDSMESDATHLRSIDAIDPSTKQAKTMLSDGFIHIGVSPGNTNTSAGVMGHIRLGANDYVANPTIASQFNLTKSARNSARFPASLNGQIQMLTNVLKGQPIPSRVYVTSAIDRSIKKEKIQSIDAVRSGKTKAILAANSNLEIRSAIMLAKQHKLAGAIRSNGRVGELAEKISEQKLGIIIPSANGTEYDSTLEQFLIANQAGVPIAFEGDSAKQIRLTAALLVTAGLDRQAALKGLTSGGAELVGMEKTSLTRGAPADFVVWTASPLNLSAKPINVVVDGQIVSTK